MLICRYILRKSTGLVDVCLTNGINSTKENVSNWNPIVYFFLLVQIMFDTYCKYGSGINIRFIANRLFMYYRTGLYIKFDLNAHDLHA